MNTLCDFKKKLFCSACWEELSTKKSIIKLHIKSQVVYNHWTGTVDWNGGVERWNHKFSKNEVKKVTMLCCFNAERDIQVDVSMNNYTLNMHNIIGKLGFLSLSYHSGSKLCL